MQDPIETAQLPQAVIELLIEICARELVTAVFDSAPSELEADHPNQID